MKEEKTTTASSLESIPAYGACPDIELDKNQFDDKGNLIFIRDNSRNPLSLDQQTCLSVRLDILKNLAAGLLDLDPIHGPSMTVEERIKGLTVLLNQIKEDLKPGEILGSIRNSECIPVIDKEVEYMDRVGLNAHNVFFMVPFTISATIKAFCKSSRDLCKDVRYHRKLIWKLYCDLWKERNELSLSLKETLSTPEKVEE